MYCPRCNEMMEITTTKDVVAHTCFYCEGIWLSEDAFKAVDINPSHRQEIERLTENPEGISRQPPTRRCPVCSGKRLEIIYNDKLELDRCSSCKGIFFDKGELTGEDVPIGENRKGELGNIVAAEGAFWALFLFFGN